MGSWRGDGRGRRQRSAGLVDQIPHEASDEKDGHGSHSKIAEEVVHDVEGADLDEGNQRELRMVSALAAAKYRRLISTKQNPVRGQMWRKKSARKAAVS